MRFSINVIFRVVTTIYVVSFLSSCASVAEDLFEGMADSNCVQNAEIKVNEDRKVILLSKFHIFMSNENDANGNYTSHPFTGLKWYNKDLYAYGNMEYIE